jgi:amino acid adenylation domain-containing protein/non-ribosomal peptide synthase protein (TIGR01720 family)
MTPKDIDNQLNQRITALPPEKRLLFEQLRRQQSNSEQLLIRRRHQGSEKLPLSKAQERLWFLHQVDNNSAYNIAIAWRLTGELNISILLESLQLIVERHEVLQTRILSHEGKPYQEVTSNIQLTLPVIDLQILSPTQQEDEVRRLSLQEASQSFNLDQAPLLRVKLICLGNNKFTLLLTLHHIIADGWSRGILLRELAHNYKMLSSQQKPSLPELTIQYADFALWQREWLQGEEIKAQLAYWQQKLAATPVLEIPTDKKRPPIQTWNGATESDTLPLELLKSLKNLSQQQGVTLFMLLLAAFKILLHRYCQQNDIVLGVPSANRNRSEVEPLIGFFVNTLALRTDLSGNPGFLTVLERVRVTAAEAFQNQDIPFASLVEALQPERDLSHNPLVQVMFQVQNEAYQLQNDLTLDLQLPNLQIEQTWVDTGATKFDLTCHMVERSNGLLVVIEYCTDLFEKERITRMIEHLRVLLTGIIDNPRHRVSELHIFTSPTSPPTPLLLGEGSMSMGNSTVALLGFLHQGFESQVERTPDNIAVICGAQTLSYKELNIKANQLAHYLRTLNIGAESLVGIYLERTPELIIALLAVLKSGGAYLPLDQTLPKARLEYILEDARPSVILTNSRLVGGAEVPNINATVLCLDLHEYTHEQDNLTNVVTGDNQAYIIYTSGSTGMPKGTILTHRGLANYLHWAVKTYPVAEGTGGVPVQSSISFDATITSLYTPLLVGQPVVLLPEAEEIEALTTALTSSRNFGIVKLTPAHLSILNQVLPQAPLTGYPKALIIGGEALTEQHLEFWRKYAPQTRLINEYGPTETVVGCCVYDATNTPATTNVSIGRPIANTQLYILDCYLQPLPIGIPGELYIGGDGVARGYLNRPELTAERFIPNPFCRDVTCRVSTLYKTGDSARLLADGTIEYLGRLDNQVKIKGFRVELGEIVAVLLTHPAVKAAVVVIRDIANYSRLVAYLVGQDTNVDLRAYLASKLPNYMLPSAFVWMEQLPLTTNGKVDLKNLPLPCLTRNDVTAPRTPQETTLVEIFKELGFSVGVHDNFFELGFDSILSIQLVSKANQAGIKLAPKQLFQHQTIAELATVVEIPSLATQQGLVTGKLELTPIQHWFFEQNLHKSHHFNQALLLEVAPIQVSNLKHAIYELLCHHDMLRARLSQDGTLYIGESVEECFTVVDLGGLSEYEQQQSITKLSQQSQASLNLETGLVRVVLFQLGSHKDWRLLFIIHHLVVDGVSWRILLEDLVTAYHYQPLRAKTTSFQQWAKLLLNYAQSEKLVADNWLNILNVEESVLPLDYAFDKESNIVASESEIIIKLGAVETNALLQDVPKVYHTQINDILLTALTQTFNEWTRMHSLLLDLEGHGREDVFDNIDLTRTVGWFTSIFPVNLQLNDTGNLGNDIKSIKEQLRLVPHKGISYGVLRYLKNQNQCQMQQLPQPAISFNYLGQLDVSNSQSWIQGIATEPTGYLSDPSNQRTHIINVIAWRDGEQLQVQWRYSSNLHHQGTIEKLAQVYIKKLQALIQHCLSPESGGYTPSDFAGARLNQQQLDKFINKLRPKR